MTVVTWDTVSWISVDLFNFDPSGKSLKNATVSQRVHLLLIEKDLYGHLLVSFIFPPGYP